VHQVDIVTGRKRTLVQFPSFPNFGTSPPPVVDAVPDSVRAYGNQLLVTFLTGFPFSNGDAKVLLVDPATGATAPFISWLNSAIDIVYRPRAAGERPQFFVLEYQYEFPGRGTGPRTRLQSAGGNPSGGWPQCSHQPGIRLHGR